MELLAQYIITSFIITGIWVTFQEGMVFYKIREKLFEPIKYSFVRKPLFECMICMASIWGSLIYFFVWQGSFSIDWPLFILTTAGVMTIISFAIGE